MTGFKYIIRSIVFYRKQHLALICGMAVTAAVLTGALIVGDSIRYSLTHMVDARLGKTRFAIVGGSRFMDVNLAPNLAKTLHVPVSPILMLRGIVIHPDSGTRINQAHIIGVDSSFAGISRSPFRCPAGDEVVISKTTADKLNLKIGNEVLVRVESASMIPVSSPFAKEPVPTVAMRLKIIDIATNDQLGKFNLGNDQSGVNNVFVSLSFLGRKLELAGMANTMLIAALEDNYTLSDIEVSLQSQWTLRDLGLAVRKQPGNNVYDLVSDRVFIDTVLEREIDKAVLPHQKAVTYLVNDIGFNGKHIPYSFASAVSSSISGNKLESNEVNINTWAKEDLKAGVGDSITVTYYKIGNQHELHEISQKFIIRNIIDNISRNPDSSLMPRFQGLSGTGNCRDWDAGVPIDLKRIRDKDEKYWDDYRGTPKVILSLETGKRLWKNPFGSLTSLRFDETKVPPEDLAEILLRRIKPSDLGLQVIDVRNKGTIAARNAVNFTELFLGMSIFVIAAGVLLTVLIYSLHFTGRSPETALLSGLGFSNKKIIRLRFAETSMVIVLGSIAGSLLGILYNYALIAGLNSVWNEMVRTDMLIVHVNLSSLLMGAIFSMLMAGLPVYRTTSKMLDQRVAGLLKNYTNERRDRSPKKGRSVQPGFIMLALSLLLVIFSFSVGALDNAALYLLSAAMFLGGSILLVNGLLRRIKPAQKDKIPSITRLALKNLQRYPARSLAVIALLAAGTFTVTLTGAYRKTFYGTEHLRNSGTGGYLLWAETTSPVYFDLNNREGRERLITDNIQDLDGVRFLQFDGLDGDDASCLNLNQAQQPRLLAVNPAIFDSARAFSFVRLIPGISREHPWNGLGIAFNDSTYPAFADQNVIQYSLKKKLGDTLVYINEAGKKISLILAGSISNSVFQGNILVSHAMFQKHFPSSGGSRTMLVDAPAQNQAIIARVLSQSLMDYGIEITPTSQRLATFNSVENTYLTVFMALSGLGFIIGTIGLGIVLLRNIYERKRELALMLALGFSKKQVFRIVFIENIFLLAAGFFTGLLAALVGILPSLLSPSFKVQGVFLILLTSVIFLSGLLWIYFPLKSALNKPLLPAMRNE